MAKKAIKNAAAPTQQQPDSALEPTLEERIRIRAYELYEKRQGGSGDADGDWLQAEAELTAEQQ